MDITIHIKLEAGYGWLPTVTIGPYEIYRGEFRQTAREALERALDAIANREARMEKVG